MQTLVKCPHCGHDMKFNVSSSLAEEKQFEHTDSVLYTHHDYRCKKQFVIRVQWTPPVITGHKIEGL